MPINIRFAGAAIVAVVGLAAGLLAGDRDAGGFGAIRGVPLISQPADTAAPQELSDRLAGIRRALAIRPDQTEAWQHYADVMISLDTSRRDFERRVASNQALDDGAEFGRHALVLAMAITDLHESLSPEQFAHARVLTDDLTSSIICKGLSER